MDEQIEMPLSATSASPREEGNLTGATESKKIKRRQVIQTVCLYVGFFSLVGIYCKKFSLCVISSKYDALHSQSILI